MERICFANNGSQTDASMVNLKNKAASLTQRLVCSGCHMRLADTALTLELRVDEGEDAYINVSVNVRTLTSG